MIQKTHKVCEFPEQQTAAGVLGDVLIALRRIVEGILLITFSGW